MVDQMDAPRAPETPDEAESGSGTNESRTAAAWIAQLQAMIDNVATAAAPTLREVAAKAAELAAKAGDAAGPIAHKAAEVTGDVGQRVAAKSRDFAADLRKPQDGNGHAAAGEASPDAAMPDPGFGGDETPS